MGWNTKMKNGLTVSQNCGANFREIDLHQIDAMWLDGMEHMAIERRQLPGFMEFVFFESATATPTETLKIGEYIGWTDGDREYLIGISIEKHNFHPESRLK